MPDLHPQIQRVLQVMAEANLKPIEAMTPAEAREQMEATAQARQAEPLPVNRVEEQLVSGPAGNIRVRLYRPNSAAPLPAIVYYHGGGHVIGSLDTHDLVARNLCAGAEALVASVDYRMGPEHRFPAAAEDSFAALIWVHANAKELGVDPERIAVHADPLWVDAQLFGIRVNPYQFCERVFRRRWESVLRPHAIVDRCDQRLGPGAQVARNQIMRIEAADYMPAAMVINDRRQRSRTIRPIKAHTDVARRTRDQLLLNPVDGERLRLARLRRRFHLLARLGRRHRFDRLQVGLGHDLEDALDLRMKVRHDNLRSKWSPALILSSDDAIRSRPAAPDVQVRCSVPVGVGGRFSPRRCDHVDIRIIGRVARNAGPDLEYLCVAARAVPEAMTVRVLRREPGGIPGAKHLPTSVGDEDDLAGKDIDELVAAGVPMTLARPCARRQPA